MKLRDHQKEITDTMQQKWGQVLVPTGGGKTMCMIVDAKWRFSMPCLLYTSDAADDP